MFLCIVTVNVASFIKSIEPMWIKYRKDFEIHDVMHVLTCRGFEIQKVKL